MVSCVVKCCKNNTSSTNKSDGVTFHLFPTDIARKNKWVALIRKSRKEPQWQPNKSSVVCSNHFHKYDLYMTERGLRRVKKSGYPKKNLPGLDDQDIVDTISPSTSAPPSLNLPEFNPATVVKKEEGKKIHLFAPDSTLPCSSAVPALDLPEFNPAIVVKKEEMKKIHLFTPDTTLPCSPAAPALDTPELINPAGDEKLMPCISIAPTFELFDPLAFATVLPSTPAVSTPVPPALSKMTDKQDAIYDTPREYKLRLKIERQKNYIQKKNKKIKILQQRVRRLQKKNKSLKDLLGTLDLKPLQQPSGLIL